MRLGRPDSNAGSGSLRFPLFFLNVKLQFRFWHSQNLSKRLGESREFRRLRRLLHNDYYKPKRLGSRLSTP